MVKYWIATVLEVPRDFKYIGPSLLDKYVETYFKVTGNIPLDRELFKSNAKLISIKIIKYVISKFPKPTNLSNI